MQLSKNAIEDLRNVLRKYGEDFERNLLDSEVEEIGNLLLTIHAEYLKMEIANPELPA